ncbi:lysozyme inhibitor LprI family protein [Pseudomonas sp. CGJS7]|uniref:lysozyme inhibitor LprI family protein n=1 Tax=Pseudomonas sp. CGJS7 TaxID=3109348 RepID=UPI00300B635C
MPPINHHKGFDRMSGFRPLRSSLLLTSLLLGSSYAIAAPPPKASETVHAASAAVLATSEEGDCFVVGELKARELCFSKKSDDEIAECERVRVHACKPYRDMYRLDQEAAALSRELLARARKQYASYTSNDAGYLTDLADYLSASDQAWAASRDTDCLLEPFAQGMSRREAGDLTEACRVERTQARIAQIRELLQALK